MRPTKTVSIVGAGPGGLTAGMILARRGFDVHIYEKNDRVGGRNAPLKLGGYTFDMGPTFLMLPQILEEVFELAGCRASDYLDLKRIDPLYRLRFGDGTEFFPAADNEETARRIEQLFPGDGDGYRRYLEHERRKIEAVLPCLRVSYDRWYHYLRPRLLKALPRLDVHRSVYDCISRFFQHELLRLSMTFQAKYLGMSPWECPGTFTILSAFEHLHGIYHPIGGLNRISDAMAAIVRKHGGQIHLGQPVKRVIVERGRACGLELGNGDRVHGDAVVINPDFAYAMTNLVDRSARKRFTDENLARRQYSCSTFMLYLGIRGRYDTPHHNIFFSNDYRRNVQEIMSGTLSRDSSFYVQNAAVTDPTLAPEGNSTLYVLVPVPNLASGLTWTPEQTSSFRQQVLDLMKTKAGFDDLEDRIEVEKIITPADWRSQENVYQGAVFNLAHTLTQMLYLRPRNRFQEFERCYLVGGGTHPGSGLPTIFESGRIAADLIGEDLGSAIPRSVPERLLAHSPA